MVIARVIERRFDALADEAVEAIVGRIPGYSGASQATAADIRRHVLAHYRAFVAALDSGEPASREDLSFIREYAARRVGEVSVGDFVSAFVLAQGLLWRAIRDLPRQSRTAQLASADALLQYFEVAISHAAEVYLEHVNLTAAADERSRRDVLSDLLAGRSLRPGRLSHAAEAHGLAADTPALVLCAATADGSADPLVLRAASGGSRRPCTPTSPHWRSCGTTRSWWWRTSRPRRATSERASPERTGGWRRGASASWSEGAWSPTPCAGCPRRTTRRCWHAHAPPSPAGCWCSPI
jgi:hypothetical protein